MSLTSRCWWSAPRPRRYLSNPVAVSALEYDASPSSQAAIRRWVHRCDAGGSSVTIRVTDHRSMIIKQPGADPVHVQPGEFLVLNRAHGIARWSSQSADRFQAEFQVLPVELPIYDDGETA